MRGLLSRERIVGSLRYTICLFFFLKDETDIREIDMYYSIITLQYGLIVFHFGEGWGGADGNCFVSDSDRLLG